MILRYVGRHRIPSRVGARGQAPHHCLRNLSRLLPIGYPAVKGHGHRIRSRLQDAADTCRGVRGRSAPLFTELVSYPSYTCSGLAEKGRGSPSFARTFARARNARTHGATGALRAGLGLPRVAHRAQGVFVCVCVRACVCVSVCCVFACVSLCMRT